MLKFIRRLGSQTKGKIKMLYTQIETHTVILRRTMEITPEDLIEAGVMEQDVLDYMEDPETVNPETDDIISELIFSIAEERDCEEEWWSDNKGCTEYKWVVEE